jgi:hypothetical protein
VKNARFDDRNPWQSTPRRNARPVVKLSENLNQVIGEVTADQLTAESPVGIPVAILDSEMGFNHNPLRAGSQFAE